MFDPDKIKEAKQSAASKETERPTFQRDPAKEQEISENFPKVEGIGIGIANGVTGYMVYHSGLNKVEKAEIQRLLPGEVEFVKNRKFKPLGVSK